MYCHLLRTCSLVNLLLVFQPVIPQLHLQHTELTHYHVHLWFCGLQSWDIESLFLVTQLQGKLNVHSVQLTKKAKQTVENIELMLRAALKAFHKTEIQVTKVRMLH